MDNLRQLKGVIVPMISPFTADGSVDTTAVKKIINHLSNAGVSAFIQGTTGEALSISNSERIRFTEAAVEVERKGFPLYAGISHHCFSDSVKLAARYLELGVDVLVVHLPTFYQLSEDQILTYYERLADAVDGPLMIYNNPKTVHMSIPIGVVEKLSYHPNIYGIKDSEREMTRHEALIELSKGRDDFSHFLGWASQSVYALSKGSDGIVPSTGNLVPKLYRQLYEAVQSGNMQKAESLQKEVDNISATYKKGKNLGESLAGLKVMMNKIGLCKKNMLSPLMDCSFEAEQQILADMQTKRLKEEEY